MPEILELLLVTGRFPVWSQTFIVNKATALAAEGHRVTVLATGPCDPALDPVVGIRVVYRPQTAFATVVHVLRHPLFTSRLAVALVHRHRVGRQFWRRLHRGLALAGHGRRPRAIVHFEWAAKAAECPDVLDLLPGATVVSCRGTDVRLMAPADPGFAADLSRVFAKVDAVHCVSQAVLEAATAYGLDPGKAFVNHPGVDVQHFGGAPHPGGPPRIASVGRLHPVKGYDHALKAVRLLKDRGFDAVYTIVGPGDPADLHRTIAELDLTDRVFLAGPQLPDQIKDVLAETHVFLLPSVSEGMSNAALEAMAMARPVVVTGVGGMAELVRDGIDGFIVPAGDAVAMAYRLEELMVNPDLRITMGNAARMRARERFSLQRQTDAFVEAYDRLCSRVNVP